MGRFRQGLGVVAFLAGVGLAGLVFAASGDKLADKGKIEPPATVAIDFGDDSSQFANDGECDDPRFSGEGASKRPAEEDRMRDASDCSAAMTAGTVSYDGGPAVPVIDFGDDSSSYANNGECDDPRFAGSTGMAGVLLSGDLMRDATDCRTLVENGSITLIPVFGADYVAGAPYDASGIRFGNDSGSFANNDECDDPRFLGPGTASTLLDDDLLRDATDCEAAYVAGTVVLKSGAEASPDIDLTVYTSGLDPSIDFGENTSDYKNNGECDDPRFEGEGVASVLNSGDTARDAKDCSELFDAGRVTMLPVFTPGYADGAPYDSAGIAFGDNTSDYKDNDECDDPRFIGPGVAGVLLDDDEMRDAVDCQAQFEAGRAVLRAGAEAQPVVDTTVYTSTRDPAIEFGDNTSSYKDNDECDDPRFSGEGVADVLLSGDMLHDAKDCSVLFDAGRISLIPVYHPTYADGAPYDSSGIDFGDNTSSYAGNGECDDPRFAGPGVATVVLDDDALRDADDCRAAYEAGRAALKDAPATPAADVTTAGDFDYGDDTSSYANDGECDDPRFFGEGTAASLLASDLGHDATDCRTLVEAGSIVPIPVFDQAYAAGAPYDAAGIDFGDDTSTYANNDECDDPRFVGPGMASIVIEADTLHDATDCRGRFEAGLVMLKTAVGAAPVTTTVAPDAPRVVSGIDFGDDDSDYAENGECDDRRFAGDGMASILLAGDIEHDATDCRTLFDAGRIALVPVFAPDYVNGAPYDATGVDFGDDSSPYASNDECDDPRFVGPGSAATLVESDTLRDATDCRVKFEAGLVALVAVPGATPVTPTVVPEPPGPVSDIDFGTDESSYANNGECDDIRFVGEGMAEILLVTDIEQDATDCRALVDRGSIALRPVYQPDYVDGAPYDSADIDFGEDSAADNNNDGECDDPRFVGPGLNWLAILEDEGTDATDCRAAFEAGRVVLLEG